MIIRIVFLTALNQFSYRIIFYFYFSMWYIPESAGLELILVHVRFLNVFLGLRILLSDDAAHMAVFTVTDLFDHQKCN